MVRRGLNLNQLRHSRALTHQHSVNTVCLNSSQICGKTKQGDGSQTVSLHLNSCICGRVFPGQASSSALHPAAYPLQPHCPTASTLTLNGVRGICIGIVDTGDIVASWLLACLSTLSVGGVTHRTPPRSDRCQFAQKIRVPKAGKEKASKSRVGHNSADPADHRKTCHRLDICTAHAVSWVAPVARVAVCAVCAIRQRFLPLADGAILAVLTGTGPRTLRPHLLVLKHMTSVVCHYQHRRDTSEVCWPVAQPVCGLARATR